MEDNLIISLPIYIVGEVMVESWNKIPFHSKLNSTVQIEESINFLGGMATNSAIALSSLGFETDLITHLGTNSSHSIESLTKKGISIKNCTHSETESSVVYAFFTDKGYHHYHLMANEPDKHNSKLQTILSDSENSTFLLTGGHYQYFRDLYRNISKHKGENKIVFSPSYALTSFSYAELESIISNTDLLILNETEVEWFCKTLDTTPDQVIQKGPKIFIETRGINGCKVFERNGREILHIPPIPVKIMNPIGAGDAFTAGFLAGLFHRQNTRNCACLGNALASICVSKLEVQVESTLPALISLCKSHYEKFDYI